MHYILCTLIAQVLHTLCIVHYVLYKGHYNVYYDVMCHIRYIIVSNDLQVDQGTRGIYYCIKIQGAQKSIYYIYIFRAQVRNSAHHPS